jgi:hypothetical protein
MLILFIEHQKKDRTITQNLLNINDSFIKNLLPQVKKKTLCLCKQ